MITTTQFDTMHVDVAEPRSARDAEQLALALDIERLIRSWLASSAEPPASRPDEPMRITFEPVG